MAQKISITLDQEVLEFIDSQTTNRSKLINEVFAKMRKNYALEQLKQAYIDQAKDSEEIAEIELWDITAGDGLTRKLYFYN